MPRLAELAEPKSRNRCTPSDGPANSARGVSGERPRTGCTTSALAMTGMSGVSRKGATINGPLLEWAVVQEMDAKEASVVEEETRQRQQKLKQEHLDQLNAQRDRQAREKDEHRQLWLRWRTEVEADAEAYHQEEVQKKQAKKEVLQRFDQERRQQVADNRQRQQAQQQADVQEGESMLRAAAEAVRKAEEQDAQRKDKERTEALKMVVAAKVAREDKEKKKREEFKRDIVLAKQQEDLLDKQEEDRGRFFKQLKEKQSRLLSAYEAGVGNELDKKQKEDDERAKKYQDMLFEKERKAADLKENKLKAMKKASQDAVEAQLQEHALEKKRRKDEEVELMQKLRQQTEEENAREKAKQEEKRRARQANAGELLEQIRQRSQNTPYRQARDQMNEVERRMNRAKLERVLEEKDAKRLSARGGAKSPAKSANMSGSLPRQPQTAR